MIKKILAAPQGPDLDIVTNLFADKCNCYSYAVQDYFAGYISSRDSDDANYLPRPGQSRGKSYIDLLGQNVEGMRRAIHEDGLNYAGIHYPRRIPENHYVICCFLEPNQYHFIRQNQDGSWSSKNGRGAPSQLDDFDEPLLDPENFYHKNPDCPFVGYFFVPKGGIHVGVHAFEERRLTQLNAHPLHTLKDKKEHSILSECVELTKYSDTIKQKMRDLWDIDTVIAKAERRVLWDDYQRKVEKLSRSCQAMGYVRRKILKESYTRPKQVARKTIGRGS